MVKEYRVTMPLEGLTRNGKELRIGVFWREISMTKMLGLLLYSFHTNHHKGDWWLYL